MREADLPNVRYRQYLTAKETMKHVISSCVVWLPGIRVEGTNVQPEWQAAPERAGERAAIAGRRKDRPGEPCPKFCP